MRVSVSVRGPGGLARRVAGATANRAPGLIEVYRLLRNPRWQAAVWRDLRQTRRAAQFVRAFSEPSPNAPVAILCLYRDNVFDTKLALILSIGLRLQGFETPVLVPTNASAQRVRRYATAFGVGRVISADRIRLTESEKAEVADTARELLQPSLRFQEMKGWQFRGWPIGDHVLSTLIRATLNGSPDLKEDTTRRLLARVLNDVLIINIRATRLLDALDPKLLLVTEAGYVPNGPLVDLAVERDVDVIQTVPTWRDDALVSKRLAKDNRRVDPSSVAAETLKELEREPWTAEQDAELETDFSRRYEGTWTLGASDHPATDEMSSADIITELGLDPQRRTAVIFAHVLWDASLFFGVDLFENYTDWLAETVAMAVGNPDVNWIVKAHPSNVFRSAQGHISGEASEVALLRARWPRLPDHVRLLLPDTRIGARSLYSFADYGVTVRGTPGLEMACYGKPVLTAGTGKYSGLGFTVDSSSRDEYRDRLLHIARYDPLSREMTDRARRYAYALFLQRPWRLRSMAMILDFPEQGWHPLDRNVELTVRSLDELRANGDLDEWATWAAFSRKFDFMQGESEARATSRAAPGGP